MCENTAEMKGNPACDDWMPSAVCCLQVVASTAVLMILFSSSTISLSYLFNGMLNTHYAVVFAPICFAASLVGVTVVGRLVKRTGRSSI